MYTPMLFTELKKYSKDKFIGDLIAGLTVGVVALPLAMAFAIASGLPPEKGLFTAIVGGLIISLLGGSKVQIGGPTGAFVVIVSSILVKYGFSGLLVSTMIAGIMLVLFGLFRFGAIIKFIPFPVITGFTTGIAVVIFSTQIKDFFGLNMQHIPAEFIPKWHEYFLSFHTMNIQALFVALLTVVVVIIGRKVLPKIPSMLLAMVVVTIVAYLLKLNVDTIGSKFGDLPRVLPMPKFPQIDFKQLSELIKPAFTIAILCAVESLLSATVADGMIGAKHRPNAELIGQGIANFFSAIFGGIPATGALARTAVNIRCGAFTPLAGIIHAITLAFILFVIAPLAKLIPLASLAAILVIVAHNMSEIKHFRSILRGPKSDSLVLIITFLLTVFVDLTIAIEVGLVLSSFLFIRRMAEITNVGVITRELKGDEEIADDPNALALRDVPKGVEVFEVNGPFFFGMVDTFKNSMQAIEKRVPVLIIRMRNVPAVDATALHTLKELYHQYKREGTHLIFSGVHSQPLMMFHKTEFAKLVGEENLTANIDAALTRAREYLEKQGLS